MPKAWRKIKEIETCKRCGSPLITIHNDSNVYAYAQCEDCADTTDLEFAEPYIYELHKHYRILAEIDAKDPKVT